MTLKARITDDMKTAMRARESERLGAIRLLLAAIKQREVDGRIELDDAAILDVIDKMVKQRRESIAQFEAAGRTDLVAQENFELDVLRAYLPQALTEQEIDALVAQALAEVKPTGPKDMGKVIALLKPQMAGRADMARVSALVKAKLPAAG